MLSRIPSHTGSLERKHKWCWWWQRLLVWHPRWGDLSAAEWICKQRKTVRGVIKGCRRNQHTQSEARTSLFIAHLHLCIQRRVRSRERVDGPVLFAKDGGAVRNKGEELLPWKPWRNLEPSGRSSGAYSLYPPTKSWLNTLRPIRGPGDVPVLLRCPSTWRKRRYKMSVINCTFSVDSWTLLLFVGLQKGRKVQVNFMKLSMGS